MIIANRSYITLDGSDYDLLYEYSLITKELILELESRNNNIDTISQMITNATDKAMYTIITEKGKQNG